MLSYQAFQKLCHARALIQDCYQQPLTLDDLATEIDYSPWHFLRLFRDQFQTTPHQMLTEIRLRKARELITTSSKSITEICFDVGFESLGSFSSLFRKRIGLSPIEFRRSIRKLVTTPGRVPTSFVPTCFVYRFCQSVSMKSATNDS